MQDFKLYLLDWRTWAGLGVAAVGGVWWYRMTANRANAALIFGVLALVVATFLYLGDRGFPLRILWSLFVFSGATLVTYYLLWDHSPEPSAIVSPPPTEEPLPYQLDHVVFRDPFPTSGVTDGLAWKEDEVAVHVDLHNPNTADFSDIHLRISTDQTILEVKERSNVPDISITPERFMSGVIGMKEDETGKQVAIPVDSAAISTGNAYLVYSPKLPGKMSIRLTLKVAAMPLMVNGRFQATPRTLPKGIRIDGDYTIQGKLIKLDAPRRELNVQ